MEITKDSIKMFFNLSEIPDGTDDKMSIKMIFGGSLIVNKEGSNIYFEYHNKNHTTAAASIRCPFNKLQSLLRRFCHDAAYMIEKEIRNICIKNPDIKTNRNLSIETFELSCEHLDGTFFNYITHQNIQDLHNDLDLAVNELIQFISNIQ